MAHIHVKSVSDAWKTAQLIVNDYSKDETASNNAGYPIYRSAESYYTYICDLADRLEVNKADGETINIWIEEEKEEASKPEVTLYRYVVDCGGDEVFARYDYSMLPIEAFTKDIEESYNCEVLKIEAINDGSYKAFQEQIYSNLLQGVRFGETEARLIAKLVRFEKF